MVELETLEVWVVTKLFILLLFSFIFTQEPCEGTCFSEKEVVNITNNIKELEFKLEKSKEIEENLNSQIYMYIQSDSLYKSQIEDYKRQLELKEEMIDLVKPKWYHNRYLWFGFGVAFTSGNVLLAGQLN